MLNKNLIIHHNFNILRDQKIKSQTFYYKENYKIYKKMKNKFKKKICQWMNVIALIITNIVPKTMKRMTLISHLNQVMIKISNLRLSLELRKPMSLTL